MALICDKTRVGLSVTVHYGRHGRKRINVERVFRFAFLATYITISVFAIQAAMRKNLVISGCSLAIMAIVLSIFKIINTNTKIPKDSWLFTFLFAIPLILGVLHLLPFKILDVRQLGYGLIGSVTVAYGLDIIRYCSFSCRDNRVGMWENPFHY